MPSRMITRRQKSARNVCAAIARHSQKAQEAFNGVLGPILGEGEATPDLLALQLLLEKFLEQHRTELVLSDEAHLQELRDGAALRARRDAAIAALAERLTHLRNAMAGVFGETAADNFMGIGGAMVRDPDVLARKARRVLNLLQSEISEMPPPLVAGFTVDPKAWAADLEGPVQELEEALTVAAWDRRDAETTLLTKHRALEKYDRAFQKVAQLQESIFRFADLKDLADRVRPSARRPGLTLDESHSEEEAARSEDAQPDVSSPANDTEETASAV